MALPISFVKLITPSCYSYAIGGGCGKEEEDIVVILGSPIIITMSFSEGSNRHAAGAAEDDAADPDADERLLLEVLRGKEADMSAVIPFGVCC
jgi:hypothetical protein